MKKVGALLTLTFIFYLIGQVIWFFAVLSEQPLFTSKYLEDITFVVIYTFSGIFGLFSGIVLYKLNK
ncbi:MAG: hypothetical protein VX762_00745 [Bacteroidota bacterium]|nr:hypothetical protein [Bacteroidota bacterium]